MYSKGQYLINEIHAQFVFLEQRLAGPRTLKTGLGQDNPVVKARQVQLKYIRASHPWQQGAYRLWRC